MWFQMGGSVLDRTDDFKKLRIKTWSGSIFWDQDWTRTEKLHIPLISALVHSVSYRTSGKHRQQSGSG